ncbi:hypothetical protein EBT23_03625 [bacterium]|nr:hypothetical protein [bacterium]
MAGSEAMALGGLGLPVNRQKLLFWFQLGALAYAVYFYFTVKVQSVEVFLALGLLAFLCLLPSYLWCAGKAHGLPIMPVFALGMFPAYILPIQTDSQVLAGYDAELQLKALLSACGLMVVMTGIWHQLCNHAFSGPPRCRLLDLSKATWLLVTFMVLGLLFQVAGLLFFKYGGGAFAMVRGYTGNGATLALFAFSFQLGQGKLSPPMRIFLFAIVGAQIVVDSVSFILAGTLVKLGILLAGYTLGSQKIPWKSALAALSVLVVLHAGKADMRGAGGLQNLGNRTDAGGSGAGCRGGTGRDGAGLSEGAVSDAGKSALFGGGNLSDNPVPAGAPGSERKKRCCPHRQLDSGLRLRVSPGRGARQNLDCL